MGHFNIRVYGILINNYREILVSDELIKGKYITKFPGGGMEFGEGTIACLKREFLEETGLSISVMEHFYTTDFFQLSAFHPQHQIISIYYLVKTSDYSPLKLGLKSFDFNEEQMKLYETSQQIERCRFIPIKELNANCMSLPIDKVVAELIQKRMSEH